MRHMPINLQNHWFFVIRMHFSDGLEINTPNDMQKGLKKLAVCCVFEKPARMACIKHPRNAYKTCVFLIVLKGRMPSTFINIEKPWFFIIRMHFLEQGRHPAPSGMCCSALLWAALCCSWAALELAEAKNIYFHWKNEAFAAQDAKSVEIPLEILIFVQFDWFLILGGIMQES